MKRSTERGQDCLAVRQIDPGQDFVTKNSGNGGACYTLFRRKSQEKVSEPKILAKPQPQLYKVSSSFKQKHSIAYLSKPKLKLQKPTAQGQVPNQAIKPKEITLDFHTQSLKAKSLAAQPQTQRNDGNVSAELVFQNHRILQTLNSANERPDSVSHQTKGKYTKIQKLIDQKRLGVSTSTCSDLQKENNFSLKRAGSMKYVSYRAAEK